jgi:malonate transporter MadM subunit
MTDVVRNTVAANGLLVAFAVVGATMLVSGWLSTCCTGGRVHGSAIAILLGLVAAAVAGGPRGVADLPLLAGVGLLGGPMLRDLAIVATAFGVRPQEFVRSGALGVVSLVTGLCTAFVAGGVIAWTCGYRDAVSVTTIGAGAATYIVGPVTGSALGAGSDVIALSIAAGLVKAVAVMVATPLLASTIGLSTPRAAMIYGGMMGTNSGVMAGLAATDPALVPYGAMTATFYTGLGCLLGPSVFFMIARAIV